MGIITQNGCVCVNRTTIHYNYMYNTVHIPEIYRKMEDEEGRKYRTETELEDDEMCEDGGR
jgi:hypothetical protein